VQPLPPLPPTNNDGLANNNEPNDGAIDSLLVSMSTNDENEMILASDEDLFEQPPKNEDCPICFIRMPCLSTGYKYKSCCGKVICSGCIYAVKNMIKGADLCPFCRTSAPSSNKEIVERINKRADVGDAMAIYNQGCYYNAGSDGFPQNYTKALELFHRAGELGDAKAYYSIGCAYDNGRGVERDINKARNYWERAAMRGNIMARHNLACLEGKSKNFEKAFKHLMIAVRSGDAECLKKIGWLYSKGHATKEDYTKALRARQLYVDEIRSDQRDKAAAFDERFKYYSKAFKCY